MSRTLQLSVWHYDRFGHNAFLGEVEVPLDCHDIDSGQEECETLRGKVVEQMCSGAVECNSLMLCFISTVI